MSHAFYVVKECRRADFEAAELWKGRSGWDLSYTRTSNFLKQNTGIVPDQNIWYQRHEFRRREEKCVSNRE